MGKMTGGDIVVRALEDEGVGFTFGIPGTHNIELYDSLARSKSVRTKIHPLACQGMQSSSTDGDSSSIQPEMRNRGNPGKHKRSSRKVGDSG
jgi:acetolactate synthase-1/2/3 large subunit